MTNTIAKDTQPLLAILKEHEELLSDLYSVYAKRFEEHISFWSELSREETDHAGWLQDLADQIADYQNAFVADRFPVAAVKISIEHVNKQIEKATKHEFTHRDALSIALDLEVSLLENKYFEVLEGDHPRVKQVLQLLSQSTKEHLQTIRNAVKESKL